MDERMNDHTPPSETLPYHSASLNPSISKQPSTTFPIFMQLPTELRGMIWEYAIPLQNRKILCPAFRGIKAVIPQTPPLFLAYKESKHWAQKKYQKVTRRDILMGNWYTMEKKTRNQAIAISVEHDIFVIQPEHWRMWNTSVSYPARDMSDSLANGKKLTQACKMIERFSQRRIRRVCVRCDRCKMQQKWPHMYHRSCHDVCFRLCERIYFPSCPAESLGYIDSGDWSWKWASGIEEVYHDRICGGEPVREFPPQRHCWCRLCRDARAKNRVPPRSFEEHEDLFRAQRAGLL